MRPQEGCPWLARTVCKDPLSGLTRWKSDLSHTEVRGLSFIEFSHKERIRTNGSGARNLLFLQQSHRQGFMISLVTLSRSRSVFVFVLHPLTCTPVSYQISGQAGGPVLRTNGEEQLGWSLKASLLASSVTGTQNTSGACFPKPPYSAVSALSLLPETRCLYGSIRITSPTSACAREASCHRYIGTTRIHYWMHSVLPQHQENSQLKLSVWQIVDLAQAAWVSLHQQSLASEGLVWWFGTAKDGTTDGRVCEEEWRTRVTILGLFATQYSNRLEICGYR